LLRGAEPDLVELGHSVDEHRHVVAHLGFDLDEAQLRVLDGVVQQGRGHGRLVEAEAGEDGRHADGMRDERLSGLAVLVGVGRIGDLVGPLDESRAGSGTSRPGLSKQPDEPRRGGLADRSNAL
jgi:hypothetical protein